LLPPQKAWTGQPAAEHRRIVMASSGCIVQVPWRDIPAERYGNHRTISVGSIGGEKQGFGNGYGQT